MAKQSWKPGNMLYPLPVVLVSVANAKGEQNVFTVAWAGTICSDPPMVSISVRPERYSYNFIKETGEFVINLTTRELAYATDYCGVRSGRDENKFDTLHLSVSKADKVMPPLIEQSPINLECKVTQIQELGTHHMFLAEVVAVHADEKYIDETGKFSLQKAEPLVYSHGEYYDLGKKLGKFGYSVKK